MRAAVLMPVLVLAVSAGHAEMGFAQGLPGQQSKTNTGASASALNSNGNRLVVAYGAAYGAPGNQPNYAPNGGRPNVSLPGGTTDQDSDLTPAQRAAAALAAIKIPSLNTGLNNTNPAANQAAMPTISTVSPTYGAVYGAPAAAPQPAPSSAVPMPSAAGLATKTALTPTQVVMRPPQPGQITGLPLGMTNTMGGAATAPLQNNINLPPASQPAAETAPTTVPQTAYRVPAYQPPAYQPLAYQAPQQQAAAPVYRAPAAYVAPAAVAPTYAAPTAQTVTYRAPAYVPLQPAYVAPQPAYVAPQPAYVAPAPVRTVVPVRQTPMVDPASCAPANAVTTATPVAYTPAAPVVLPRPPEPERLPVVAGGPGFTLVAPPPGAPYPNAGYVEPGSPVAQTISARIPAQAPLQANTVQANTVQQANTTNAFLPTTQAHPVGQVRGLSAVRAATAAHRRHSEHEHSAGTNTDPWANQ